MMLTKVLVYAICGGVFSVGEDSAPIGRDVAFRVLATGNERIEG